MDLARVALLAAVLLAGVLLCGWVLAPVRRGPAAARRDLGSLRLTLGSVGVVLFLNLLLTLPLAGVLQQTGDMARLLIGAAATEAPMLALLYVRVVRPGAADWRQLGLRRLPVLDVLWRGMLTGWAGILLVAVVGVALQRFHIRSNQSDEFLFLRGSGPAGVAAVLLVAAVLAPIVEELFFRGYLFGCMLRRRRWPAWLAYLLTSAVFAVLHVQPGSMDLAQSAGVFAGIFVLGLLLAWTYAQSGSLWPGIVAHGVNNAISLGLLLLARGQGAG